MNVYLTFDIEVWCNGWNDLDRAFPACFERYVYGHSAHGDYALPKTLELLNQHGLKGVFFVEPLFAARFGQPYLDTIVGLIRAAGQDVQLHLHPEWTDEALQPLIPDCASKRQHLSYYTLEEQTTLIACGKQMLEAAGSGPITAFRSGSFAANQDTFTALHRNQLLLDSSLNRCHAVSAPDLLQGRDLESVFAVDGVTSFPVTVFQDGFGKDRPAQVGACSFAEMRDALWSAQRAGMAHFVLVSHNFEMLKPGLSQPDWVVVKRFAQLCAFLGQHRDTFTVGSFGPASAIGPAKVSQPRVGWTSTARRYVEQALRRLP
ncbi:hypothetical protein SAMN05216303_1011358 [Rhodoferax sp. OV413]|uniref:polysaccharide deacetylase family protein n=1 Tax=Rhodoferax sp. OV413 TaxID=1855285 RepID=UPI000889ADDD|nr:hypothetical protein [Rhodoferax sp. OV413]SDO41411.1 hypothetical protein SAMN05216303_1011358 [Rhodoferax sp. OV413]